MNHKGQVLILFALLLPLLLMFVGLIIDTGFLYVEKREVDLVVKDTVEYGVSNIDIITEEELGMLLNKNIANIKAKEIIIEEGTVTITVSLQRKSLFSFILGNDRYEIESTYKGMIEKNKLKIVRG